MAIATLQRFLVAGLTITAILAVIAGMAFGRPVAGGLAGLATLLVHAFVLAFEFALLSAVEAKTSRPNPKELIAAWWDEVIATPRIFCWRQPFREHAVPDTLPSAPDGARGVLLVHGLFCNRAFWNPWLEQLAALGHPCIAVNLEPAFAEIGDQYADAIDVACRRLETATGAPPLIVAHSMGGLAVRDWLQRHRAERRVHRVITVGTPHQGTWLARFGRTSSARQMAIGSDWLRRLAELEPPGLRSHFTCFYSRCDNVVFPSECAQLPGADNRMVDGMAHVTLAFAEVVFREALRCLDTGRGEAHTPPCVEAERAEPQYPLSDESRADASSSPSVETFR